MKLKQRLSERRKASGISQETAAERLNVSRQTIGRWEQGRSVPSMENMVKLSELYGVPLEDLVQDVCELPATRRREKPASPPEEQPEAARGKPLIPTILAVIILLAAITVGVLYFQGQAEDSISTSDLDSEVIDISSGETVLLLPID